MNFKVFILEDEERWHPIIKQAVKCEIENFPIFTFDLEQDCYIAKKLDDELMQMLRTKRFHLAIIDYALDGDKNKTGHKAIKILSESEFFRKTKAIMFTAMQIDMNEVETFLSYGTFSIVQKSSKKPSANEIEEGIKRGLNKEIARALDQIEREEYMEIIGKLMDRKVPSFFRKKEFVQKLEKGCHVRKAIIVSDLAYSTKFLTWTRQKEGAIGKILADLLGWQAKTINNHEGIVDKFYGDEIRGYFGIETEDTNNPKDAEKVCNNAVNAALSIINEFPQKLENWFNIVTTDDGNRPEIIPYLRIVINYDEILWAIYGSEEHRDFTIWTENVAVVSRILTLIRSNSKKNEFCKPVRINEANNAIGHIYVTGGVRKYLTLPNVKLCKHGTPKLRSIGKRSLYSVKLENSPACQNCHLHRDLLNLSENTLSNI